MPVTIETGGKDKKPPKPTVRRNADNSPREKNPARTLVILLVLIAIIVGAQVFMAMRSRPATVAGPPGMMPGAMPMPGAPPPHLPGAPAPAAPAPK